MKIHFYGTSASEGFPALFCECTHCTEARRLGGKNIRTRTSVQIDEQLLVDFSPDTYAHAVYCGLKLTGIHHLLVSHTHPDHLYAEDLGTIFPPMADTAAERRLAVYGNPSVGQVLHKVFPAGFDSKIDYHQTDSFIPFVIGDYQIMPVRAIHKKDEACNLFVVEREGKTLLYGLDSDYYPEDTWEELSKWNFDCVIMDCTSADQKNPYPGHMGLAENIKVKSRMLKEGMATENTLFIATHFAHSFAPLHDRLTDVFVEYGIIPAYDGLEVDI